MLASKLQDGNDEHISSKIALSRETSMGGRPCDYPTGFTVLHGAAFFGCVEITVTVLEMEKWDVQAADCHGNTAVGWASGRGMRGQ